MHFCVGGPEGLRALTNPKAIMADRWPALIQTGIPKVLDYPIRSLYQSWCAQLSCGASRFECHIYQGILEWSRAFLVWGWLAQQATWAVCPHTSSSEVGWIPTMH